MHMHMHAVRCSCSCSCTWVMSPQHAFLVEKRPSTQPSLTLTHDSSQHTLCFGHQTNHMALPVPAVASRQQQGTHMHHQQSHRPCNVSLTHTSLLAGIGRHQPLIASFGSHAVGLLLAKLTASVPCAQTAAQQGSPHPPCASAALQQWMPLPAAWSDPIRWARSHTQRSAGG